MKVFLLVFLLLVHKTAYGIPIYEGESSAPREDAALAQQDVKRNEGEERYKRNSYLAPFDTKEQGRCPHTDDEWKQFRISWNCSRAREGSTYHCTLYNDNDNPREACGIPQFCDKGKGPVIVFPEGHSKVAEIKCDWCPEDYFNPLESIRSDQYSTCPEVRHKCTDRGLVECDIVKGVKQYWTDSKCECDINNNFFPPYKEKNKCSDHSGPCFEESACEKSPEGFDQIYNFSVSEDKYVCQPGCKEGFEFKNPQSKKCEPVQRNDGNSTRFENETTIYNSSSTMLVSATTTGSYTTTTETKPNTTTKIVEDAAKAGNDVRTKVVIGIFIFGILGILAVTVYLCIGCYKYFTSGATDDGRGRYIRVNEKRVSAPRYIFCWPCNKVDLPPADENVEPQVDLPPADENFELHVDMPPADENIELKVDLPPAVVPPVAAPANGNVVPQVAAPANGNVVSQVAAPANGNVVPQVAAPANGNGVPQVAEPANGNVVPQVAASANGNVVPQDAAPANGNVVPQVAAPANGNVVPQVAAPANGNVVPQNAAPANGNVVPQVAALANGNVVPQVAAPANVVPQVAAPANGNFVPQGDLPRADENGPQVDGKRTGSGKPKDLLPLEENLVGKNQTGLKVPTSEENQLQRRNMEQQDSTEYSGGNSSSSSETESQSLRPPAADGRSSIKKVQGPQVAENQPGAIVSTVNPQGKQSWIDKLPNDLKQIKVSTFIRLAEYIGYGWEALAKQIGLTMVNINQIKEDHKKMFAIIDAIINKYEQKSDNGSLEGFLNLLRRCSESTEIQWKELEEYIYRIYDEYCQN